MKYLKLFENFDDNKEVIDALKKILICIENGKMITSVLNGGTIMDLHDNCSDEEVMSFLSKAADIASEEYQGTKVSLKDVLDRNELNGLIKKLEGNPEKAEAKMKLELSESLDNFHHISEEEYSQFSQVPALGELITKSKVKLEKDRIFYDENDIETKEILDQYLEIPDKVEESITLKTIKKFNQFLNENIELSNSDLDEDDVLKRMKDFGWGDLTGTQMEEFENSDKYDGTKDSSEYAEQFNQYLKNVDFSPEYNEQDDSEDFEDYYY
jgi:hypothetical protein